MIPINKIKAVTEAAKETNKAISDLIYVNGFSIDFDQDSLNKAKKATKALAETANQKKKAVFGASNEATKAVAKAAQETATVASNVAHGLSTAAVDLSQQTTRVFTDTATGIAKAATDLGQNATKDVVLYNQNKLEAGQASKEASVSAHIEQISSAKATQIEKTVVHLKTKYLNKKPSELIQRLLFQRITRASVIAGVIGLVPGKMAESMGFDQTTLMLLQIETIYQIAAIYGLNIQSSERKIEVFAIVDRALRASRTARMYLGITHIIPYAGGVFDAGTDGYVLYLVADTARAFYELKSQETIQGKTLSFFQEKTQKEFKRLW